MSIFKSIKFISFGMALSLSGTAFAQVTNGDFSGGNTGWTNTAPAGSSLAYGGGQLTAVSDNNGGGLSRSYASQSLTAADPGFLSYTLVQYSSADYGLFDYPTVEIGGTFYWIRTTGDLTTTASQGIDNDDATINGVSGFQNFAAGTSTIGFGVTSTDSCCGAGSAIWDNIDFQELAQSPGAQTVVQNGSLAFLGANQLVVADNGPNAISVTLNVNNGTLAIAGGSGATLGGNGTGAVTVSGTPAQVNAALASLVYTPNTGYSGADTLTFGSSGNGLTDTDTIAITVEAPPTYSLTKTGNLAQVSAAGDAIVYTVTLTHTGGGFIDGITLSDALVQGAGTTVVTLTGPTGDGSRLGVLEPGEAWVYSVTYTVSQAEIDNGSDLVNTANVSSNQVATQSASDTVTILSNPSFDLVKVSSAPGFTTGNISNAPAGTIVTYSYTVTNTGNKTIANVAVNDIHTGTGTAPIPSNETISTDVAPLGDSTDGATNNVWDSLAPGDAVTFTGSYTITQADVDTLQ